MAGGRKYTRNNSSSQQLPERGPVESLIYWRDVKKSGIVFGAGLVTLLAISCFSVISVFAYLSLILLTGTIAFRIYKSIMQAIQKTSDGHPFKEYLEFDLTLSQEKIQNIAGVAVAHLNGFIAELRRLFLVEDLVDSIKFGVILWVMTYIGAWFNGMTLVILAFVSLFTLPKVYENNKQSIDTYLDLATSKFAEVTEKSENSNRSRRRGTPYTKQISIIEYLKNYNSESSLIWSQQLSQGTLLLDKT